MCQEIMFSVFNFLEFNVVIVEIPQVVFVSQCVTPLKPILIRKKSIQCGRKIKILYHTLNQCLIMDIAENKGSSQDLNW